MKIFQSSQISAFGGANFVFEYFNNIGIDRFLNQQLPELAPQSTYSWKDIIYSLYSIYFCGADCVEDLHHLRPHFEDNPFIEMPSPDTSLRRMQQLAVDNKTCRTERGNVDHLYNFNELMSKLNIAMLKKLGAFNAEEITLDYDNTILATEKQDSKMTYKGHYGYQPGVCTLNEDRILYLENRNGNSDAKSFQHETLERMFDLLADQGVDKVDCLRADAASHQYKVVKIAQERSTYFYIGCRKDYVEKYFTQITQWEEAIDSTSSKIELGEIMITPFVKQSKKDGVPPEQFRLVVKRKPNKTGQSNIFTQDAYDYRAILTNDRVRSAQYVEEKYNRRGNMEKQFDIMKNDFGWNNMPFSNLSENTVFLYFMAMCRNLYKNIIELFSMVFKGLHATNRIKRFLFKFIILPAKWIKRARQYHLRVFSKINFNT